MQPIDDQIPPALSVVVVCWNNLNELKRTVHSIRGQSFSDLELVIVDGGSGQEMVTFAKDNADILHSGPDTGVYDAMNKGISIATGKYLLFLNSGDEFYSESSVSDLMRGRESADFQDGISTLSGSVIFKHAFSDLKWVVPSVSSPSFALPHMSTAVPTELLREYKFDTRFRILGDFDLWDRLAGDQVLDVVIVPEIISIFEFGDGLSSKPINNATKSVERLMIHHRNGLPISAGFLVRSLITLARIEIFSRLPIRWRLKIWQKRHGWQKLD